MVTAVVLFVLCTWLNCHLIKTRDFCFHLKNIKGLVPVNVCNSEWSETHGTTNRTTSTTPSPCRCSLRDTVLVAHKTPVFCRRWMLVLLSFIDWFMITLLQPTEQLQCSNRKDMRFNLSLIIDTLKYRLSMIISSRSNRTDFFFSSLWWAYRPLHHIILKTVFTDSKRVNNTTQASISVAV